jgi:hypothetical protein
MALLIGHKILKPRLLITGGVLYLPPDLRQLAEEEFIQYCWFCLFLPPAGGLEVNEKRLPLGNLLNE